MSQVQRSNPDTYPPLLQCADLILPWLSPTELASVALASKTLSQISRSVTLRRSSDASRAFENLPIPFRNVVDSIPYAYFIYTPSQLLYSTYSSLYKRQYWGGSNSNSNSCFSSGTVSQLGVESVSESGGCDCEKCEGIGDGGIGCPCLGLQLLEVVSECGPICHCGLECRNRLTQKGVSIRLKIVKMETKGWGLFADQLIHEGQFICEYAGELLTTEEARRRQQIYDELTSGGEFSSALLVIREHLPSGKACLRMNIDATRVGNVARFINHSCDGGNLSTVLVRTSGSLMPRLCFFASRDIKEDEELTFSYGETRVRSKGLQCFCGSSGCLGTLPSEHT